MLAGQMMFFLKEFCEQSILKQMLKFVSLGLWLGAVAVSADYYTCIFTELGCLASTPTFSTTIPLAWDAPTKGLYFQTVPRAFFL